MTRTKTANDLKHRATKAALARREKQNAEALAKVEAHQALTRENFLARLAEWSIELPEFPGVTHVDLPGPPKIRLLGEGNKVFGQRFCAKCDTPVRSREITTVADIGDLWLLPEDLYCPDECISSTMAKYLSPTRIGEQ